MPRSILYLQYVNPGAIPPLIHSSAILAGNGWDVTMFGVAGWGEVDELSVEHLAGRRVTNFPLWQAGWRQRIGYVVYSFSAVLTAIARRPSWLYVSDVLACPPALLIAWVTRARVVYHEHDVPPVVVRQRLSYRLANRARRAIASRAAVCVLPQSERAERFRRDHPGADVLVVLNCPARGEVQGSISRRRDGLSVVYQGSINEVRMPTPVIRALAELPSDVTLHLYGYETVGSSGYTEVLRSLALKLGVESRVFFHGPVVRSDLILRISEHDVGIALAPLEHEDENLTLLAGASNKAFDYLAAGVPLLISDLPDWQSMYASDGYGVTCDPTDPSSIAGVLRGLLVDPKRRRAMGEAGRKRILEEWNYETQFGPVLERLSQQH